MVTGINEPKTLTKHISCKFKCKMDRTKNNLNQWWNNDKCRCECKKHHICEKGCAWNPATCSCENRKYLASIIDDSAIICDEVIKSYNEEKKKLFQKTLMKKVTCKTQNLGYLLEFLSITIALLIAVSIYCYLIKYREKQIHKIKTNQYC